MWLTRLRRRLGQALPLRQRAHAGNRPAVERLEDRTVPAGLNLDLNLGCLLGCLGHGSISGQKFEDHNGNGVKDDGDQGLPGWTVFLDANCNDTLDPGEVSTTTDEEGNYCFGDLCPDTYRVREVLQEGWTQTTPNPPDVEVCAGEQVTCVDFGNFENVTISGIKFKDRNGDGKKNAAAYHIYDFGLPGWTIYIDANGNGELDDGERRTVTDANGKYSFTDVGPGPHVIREVVKPGWRPTTPNPVTLEVCSGEDATVNFGNAKIVAGGAKGRAWWAGSSGQSAFTGGDLGALANLNLYAPSGSAFNPTSYSQVRGWLTHASAAAPTTSENIAYQLSVHLAVMKLNARHDYLTIQVVHAPGTNSAAAYNPMGFATIQALLAEANSALSDPGSHSFAYLSALKSALAKANANLSFVQC
jgi:hypothetical protein